LPSRGQRSARARALLLSLLTRDGPHTRSELAELSGLSLSTVIDAASLLLGQRVIEEVNTPHQRRPGRPASLLRIQPTSSLVGLLGVGRRGVHAAVIGSDATVRSKRARRMDFANPDAGLPLLVDVLNQAVADAHLVPDDLATVVLAVPAPVLGERPTTLRHDVVGLAPENSGRIQWLGTDPRNVLQNLLGAPLTVENDANLAALGEATYGVGRTFHTVIYVMLASGLGGGVVINKQLLRGTTGLAGEFGHLPVDPRGRLCVCGAIGCLGGQADIYQLLRRMEPAFDGDLTIERLGDLCTHGNRPTLRLLHDLGMTIGSALGAACVVLNPDAIIIDGTLRSSASPVIAGIREGIEHRAPAAATSAVAILPGSLQDDAGIYGALALSTNRADGRRQ
jgi:predicted NBD/HSP70 family sugar kinase